MKGHISKEARKVLERVAQSAYAVHLYEGLAIKQNYDLGEAYGYWQSAKEDAGAMCPDYVKEDANIFQLYLDHSRNVRELEDYFKRHDGKAAYERLKLRVH